MKILIIGGGGREHALTWKMQQSEKVEHIFVAPGNAGIASEEKVSTVDIPVTEIEKLVTFAQKNNIDLTIVGPEQPLSLGIVDSFRQENLRIVGPTQQACQLESSKAFAKDFMKKYRIPTASYQVFDDALFAKESLLQFSLPVVIKADGLAAGKGVVIAHTHEEAVQAIEAMMIDECYGKAGNRVVIESYLEGDELSFMILSDGQTLVPLASSQDHKKLYPNDKGPNTGGMGAYSPAAIMTESLYKKIMKEVIYPTIEGLHQEGMNYTGFLYAGLMISKRGDLHVLEYNCRLGDPETQPILMRLQSDFFELCYAASMKQLDDCDVTWDPRYALNVVMSSKGYPGSYKVGEVITGLEEVKTQPDCKVFHAGTKQQGTVCLTNGGRVLSVTALGATIEQAQHQAYRQVAKIHWDTVYYRNDIGDQAKLKKQNKIEESQDAVVE